MPHNICAKRYYQICSFPNNNVQYAIRITLFNEATGIIIDHRNREISYSRLQALQHKLSSTSYRMWPSSTLSNVPFPVQGDLLTSVSELLQ